MKDFTASELTDNAIKVLTLLGYEAWRNKNTRSKVGWSFKGKKGVPDAQGYKRFGGTAMFCETKTINDEFSRDQFDFFETLEKHGGHGYVSFERREAIHFNNNPNPFVINQTMEVLTWARYKEAFPEKLKKFWK